MRSNRVRTRLLGVAAALMVLPAVLVVGGSPAHALSCSSTYSYGAGSANGGVRVFVNWNPECSDGLARVYGGRITDTSPTRDAQARVIVSDRRANGTYFEVATSRWWINSNGQDSSASIPTWRPHSPGSVGWRIVIQWRACQVGGCINGSNTFYG
jgi:hypothetical protein